MRCMRFCEVLIVPSLGGSRYHGPREFVLRVNDELLKNHMNMSQADSLLHPQAREQIFAWLVDHIDVAKYLYFLLNRN